MKGYGTSIGSVALFAVIMIAATTLITLPYQQSENNPARWGGAPTPGLAQAWGLMDNAEDPQDTSDLFPNSADGYFNNTDPDNQDVPPTPEYASDGVPTFAYIDFVQHANAVDNSEYFGMNIRIYDFQFDPNLISTSDGMLMSKDGSIAVYPADINEVHFGYDSTYVIEGIVGRHPDEFSVGIRSAEIYIDTGWDWWNGNYDQWEYPTETDKTSAFVPEPAYDGMPTFSSSQLGYGVPDFWADYNSKRVRIYDLTFDTGIYDTNRRTLIDDAHYVVLVDFTIDGFDGFGSDVVVEGDVTGYIDYGEFKALCLDNTEISIHLTDYWVDGNYGTSPD